MRAERAAASPLTPLLAGAVYFALVFVAGFVLGAVRVLALEPAFGEFRAVAAETPVMLAICWFVSGLVVRRFAVAPEPPARLIMGVSAFAMLILAELALFMLAFGGAPSQFIAGMTAPAGLLGLAGQLLFAGFPALRLLGRTNL
ncbi:MAG: hypothetical protein AAFX09_07745 [Pseudomonadota bacterium]